MQGVPPFYSLEKIVMVDIRLCLDLDGRLYANPNNFNDH